MVLQAARRVRLTTALAFTIGLAGLAGPGPSVHRLSPSLDPALRGAPTGTIGVIVRAADGRAERAIARLGGTITRDLPIIDGFAARIPASEISSLARIAGVTSISLDRPVRLMSGSPSDAPDGALIDTIRADDVWAQGVTGAGVTVAVVDTGVSEVGDLAGRLVPVTDVLTGATETCVNFSGEAGCGDSYGHGTFVAGVVAGNGTGAGAVRKGVAPGARILSVKLSGRDGAADVSTLLAAIQWIVSHKDVYGIRVLNLSIGSDSPQSYRIDPLNYAVERAWFAGITVVVAASNLGPAPGTITKPGDDPFVITVGAIDDKGTADLADDAVPDFSARGPTLADGLLKPDLVATGAHVVSLRAPGSAIEDNFPAGVDATYRRGSGTSFATPAVAGTVALMLERNPAMTPDQVKYALMSSARAIGWANPIEVGRGTVDAYAATMNPPQGSANQGLAPSDGSGSLDQARGTLLFTADDPLGTAIAGDLTQQLVAFNPTLFTTIGWSSLDWGNAQWHGAKWHGAKWHGAKWHGAKWHGAKWHEASDETAVYGTGWLGSAIYGAWE